MFCGNCGKKLPDGATVCDACGTPVAGAVVEEKVEKAAEQVEETAVAVVADAEAAATQAADEVKALPGQVEAAVDNAGTVSEVMVNGETVSQKTESEAGESNKKKLNLPLIIGGAVAAVVVIVALVFLCSASARNGLKKAFMSNESYFCSVTEDKLDSIADTFIDGYSKLIKIASASDYEAKISAELEFEDDAEALLDKEFDAEWLKKSSAEFTTGWNNKNIYMNANLDVNKKDIVEAEFSLDTANGKAYIGIPTLSKEYAALDLEELFGDEFEDFSKSVTSAFEIADIYPTEKELRTLYDRYKSIFFNHIEKVKLYEDKSFTVEGVKMSGCTKATVELDDEQMRDMLIEMLKTAGDDNEIAAIIQRMSASEALADYLDALEVDVEDIYESFLDEIDEEIERLEDAEESDEIFRIEAYITSTGDVCALEFAMEEDGGYSKGGTTTAIGYRYAANSPNYGLNLYKNNITSKREKTEELVADGTMSGSKFSGTITYKHNGSDYGSLDFADVNLSSLKKLSLDGVLQFEVDGLSNDKDYRKLSLEVKADDLSIDGGKLVMVLHNSKVKLGEMEITVKTGSGSKVKEPSKKIDVVSDDDFTDWFDSFKWDDTISNMEDADFPRSVIKSFEKLSEGDYTGLMSLFGLYGSGAYGEIEALYDLLD